MQRSYRDFGARSWGDGFAPVFSADMIEQALGDAMRVCSLKTTRSNVAFEIRLPEAFALNQLRLRDSALIAMACRGASIDATNPHASAKGRAIPRR